MNPKLEKVRALCLKNAERLNLLQKRQQELEEKRTELENLDIVGLVRSAGMTPEELAAFLREKKEMPDPSKEVDDETT